MTTIAYHHETKTIAWDSRSTNGSGLIISDSVEKMKVVDGVRFWISGYVGDSDKFIDMYFGSDLNGARPECTAFVFENDNLLIAGVGEDGVMWKEGVYFNRAIGSGSDFALSGMILRLSAAAAVEHAKKLDSRTGGEVKEFKL